MSLQCKKKYLIKFQGIYLKYFLMFWKIYKMQQLTIRRARHCTVTSVARFWGRHTLFDDAWDFGALWHYSGP
jgi:hypothetical protein